MHKVTRGIFYPIKKSTQLTDEIFNRIHIYIRCVYYIEIQVPINRSAPISGTPLCGDYCNDYDDDDDDDDDDDGDDGDDVDDCINMMMMVVMMTVMMMVMLMTMMMVMLMTMMMMMMITMTVHNDDDDGGDL